MTDPRENCPWKCKHCLCYEGEIKRLWAVYEAADNYFAVLGFEMHYDEGLALFAAMQAAERAQGGR